MSVRCVHHVTRRPNKLWRSTSIFNLWATGCVRARNLFILIFLIVTLTLLNAKDGATLLKKVTDFPVPSRDVINQTLSGREIANLFLQCSYILFAMLQRSLQLLNENV
jgi:hypothetical protein